MCCWAVYEGSEGIGEDITSGICLAGMLPLNLFCGILRYLSTGNPLGSVSSGGRRESNQRVHPYHHRQATGRVPRVLVLTLPSIVEACYFQVVVTCVVQQWCW